VTGSQLKTNKKISGILKFRRFYILRKIFNDGSGNCQKVTGLVAGVAVDAQIHIDMG
jgi:hypothetical protein